MTFYQSWMEIGRQEENARLLLILPRRIHHLTVQLLHINKTYSEVLYEQKSRLGRLL